MRRLERPAEARLADRVKRKLGVQSIKLSLQNDAGWPDRLFLLPGGRPLFLELKRAGERPEPLQLERISTLRNLGYEAEYSSNMEEAFELLARRTREARAALEARKSRT